MKVMDDICKCPGNDCPIKSACLRFTMNDEAYGQVYFMQSPYDFEEGCCRFFISEDKYHKERMPPNCS